MSRIVLLMPETPCGAALVRALTAARQTPVWPRDGWDEPTLMVEHVAAERPDVVVLGLDDGLPILLERARLLAEAPLTRYVPQVAAGLQKQSPAALRSLLDAGIRDVVGLDGQLEIAAARIDNMAALSYLRRTFRRQNDALSARTAELDRVFETATTGLALADAAAQVVRLNEAGRAILGPHASPGDVYRIATTEGQRVPQDEHPLYRAAVRGETVEGGRYHLVGGGDGSPLRVIVLDAVPLEAPGAPMSGALAVFRDETETAALEAALRERASEFATRTEEMEAFVYTASHDMKGPLLNIRRFAAMLVEDNPALPADSQHFLQRIGVNADRLSRLVQDLLQVVKVGKMELHRDAVPLAEVIRQALQGLESTVQEVDAQVEVDPDLPTVVGDFDRLVDVFSNLLSNALKYRRMDVPCVVRVGRGPSNGAERHVFVEDNGRGIPAEQREKVFTLFHRLHTRDQIEGSGLGLGIVTRVVGRHGGRVWVESDEGRGATFHVVLPAP